MPASGPTTAPAPNIRAEAAVHPRPVPVLGGVSSTAVKMSAAGRLAGPAVEYAELMRRLGI